MIDNLCQIMQNKANFQKAQMNVNICLHEDYENFPDLRCRKNKAKQSQFQDRGQKTEDRGQMTEYRKSVHRMPPEMKPL